MHRQLECVMVSLEGVLVELTDAENRALNLLCQQELGFNIFPLSDKCQGCSTHQRMTLLGLPSILQNRLRFKLERLLIDEIKLSRAGHLSRVLGDYKKEGVMLACVSNYSDAIATRILAQLGLSEFDAVFTTADQREQKPAPTLFLDAADGLGVSLSMTRIYEKYDIGKVAAERSGASEVIVVSGTSQLMLELDDGLKALKHTPV
jgi:beta-phosphoglucomutase-like phosphatase (HAD superfamily)